MPELLLELLSEEIPARMQARGAEDLARLVTAALAPLAPADVQSFYGPRRIALACSVGATVPESRSVERGPRVTAPAQALAGFLRKHGATREALRQEGDFWVLERLQPGIAAAALIARELPPLLWRFPWPKSMRWGGRSGFTWVRPLRRILCLLDGTVVPFDLREGEDDAHGLAAGDLTEGHRFLAPGAFAVDGAAAWLAGLREHHVIADAAERRSRVADGLRDLAAHHGLSVVDDAGLLDEVTGLAEWPVPMLGRIDPGYMDLPAEVMQVSMRVNQRYFTLRDATGGVAPWFGFVANVPGRDGGAAIVAGNERVLRARFADARHFWELDRAQTLESRVPLLGRMTFHAKLGTQGERVSRLMQLARAIAPAVGADAAKVDRAALLAKADLVTGMVGEFPELQGVMGRYYALHDGEPGTVADAIRDHYAPRGAEDPPPRAPESIAVALADRVDLLAAFFAIGEKPSGSGDPFALRRAALGIIRIVREQNFRLPLRPLLSKAYELLYQTIFSQSRFAENLVSGQQSSEEVLRFIDERLRVQLRAEGVRHDVLSAIPGLGGADDQIDRMVARIEALILFLRSEDGVNLLAGYRRAANILRIEERKDGPVRGLVDTRLFELPEERALAEAADIVRQNVMSSLVGERFTQAMESLASLRSLLDAFFERVTVNDPRPGVRYNRLLILANVRGTMHLAADFSKIEG
jgi:glycyl-tRNA synthetase beta chain